METLLRAQDSPVPTHTVLGERGLTAMAPIDCTGCLSKTGLKVVPPFSDFHTPPLAAPMYTVSLPSSLTAVSADTRPLITAEPMLRAPSPEMASASNVAFCALAAAAKSSAATRAFAHDGYTSEFLMDANPRDEMGSGV